MSALAHSDIAPHERRNFTRIPVAVKGRLMLDTRQELDCTITDMSLNGMLVTAKAQVARGSTIVAYVDHFGRLQGTVVRTTPTGFAVALNVPPPKRERISNVLAWLASRGPEGTPDDRCHERIVPNTGATSLELINRRSYAARIVDFSRSGAAIMLHPLPKLDARVVIGRTTGRVVRHFNGGVGIEFLRLIPSELFDESHVL